MLRIGLTGGIGAGKSTVASRLVELGATLVDADAVAREVVRPGSEGLAQVVAEFGEGVRDADGGLDRAGLAGIVFGDKAALHRLNAILHPLIGRRTAELVASAPADAVLVQDIPLLVEGSMAPTFALVVVVDAAEDVRVQRLVEHRGMTAEEARARIAAQADRSARLAAADVWLSNSGSPQEVRAEVDRLWHDRLVPFERNVRLDRPRGPVPPKLVEPDPRWSAQYERLAARIARAAGDRCVRVDHIGSTSVPGLPAKDVLDIQLTVPELAAAAAAAPALREVGFTHRPEFRWDTPKPAEPDPERWRKRLFTSADPGRPVNLHVRAAGSPGWRFALLFRDWLRADADARADYLALKRRLLAEHAGDREVSGYAAAKDPWFAEAFDRSDRWAQSTGWRTPQPPDRTDPPE